MLHYATTIAVLAFIAFIAIIIYAMCVVSHRSDNILENYDHVELSQEASSELEKVIRHYEGEDIMATKKININKVAKFEKISFEQLKNDILSIDPEGEWTDEEIQELLDGVKLPVRATTGSAGYDISTPINIGIDPGESLKFPTGIRCKIDHGYVMLIFVRSSVGIKKNCVLSNGTGVIDSDYYNADNEGHIWIALRNDSTERVEFEMGSNICQAVFVPFGITNDDETNGIRTGGIGSTN